MYLYFSSTYLHFPRLFWYSCSTSQTGDLTKSDRAVDGIFGFGQQGLSVISQLSSIGVTPNAFSHCLKGGSQGGGTLVLGQVVEPNMVYTPLVPLQYVLLSSTIFITRLMLDILVPLVSCYHFTKTEVLKIRLFLYY